MTIKQVLIGAVLGSSIVGLMVHRMHQSKEFHSRPKLASTKIAQHKDHSHKLASIRRRRHSDRQDHNSEAELSTRELYGK